MFDPTAFLALVLIQLYCSTLEKFVPFSGKRTKAKTIVELHIFKFLQTQLRESLLSKNFNFCYNNNNNIMIIHFCILRALSALFASFIA